PPRRCHSPPAVDAGWVGEPQRRTLPDFQFQFVVQLPIELMVFDTTGTSPLVIASAFNVQHAAEDRQRAFGDLGSKPPMQRGAVSGHPIHPPEPPGRPTFLTFSSVMPSFCKIRQTKARS